MTPYDYGEWTHIWPTMHQMYKFWVPGHLTKEEVLFQLGAEKVAKIIRGNRPRYVHFNNGEKIKLYGLPSRGHLGCLITE